MDRDRWNRAKPGPEMRHHPWRDAIFVGIAATVIALPLVFTGSTLAVAICTPAVGGILAYTLSVTWERIWNYVREPVMKLESRVRDLEARPSNAVSRAAPDQPAPDFRPELREANQMLELTNGDEGEVTGWINGVFDKLFEWNVAIALEFRPAQMVATPDSVARRESWKPPAGYRPPIDKVLGLLSSPALYEPKPPALEFDPELVRLRTYRDRLIRLVPQ